MEQMGLQEKGRLGAITINGSSPGLRENVDKKRIHLYSLSSTNTYSPCEGKENGGRMLYRTQSPTLDS
jgi:hypothetical protein